MVKDKISKIFSLYATKEIDKLFNCKHFQYN